MTKQAHLKPTAGGWHRAARMLGDELLAKQVGRGSHHAFAALCERHSQPLHRYCLSILRNEHDAQDALQSTMTRAYAALRACERDVSLRAWLFRIAHNESVTILRKRASQARADQTGAAQLGDPHVVLEQRARLSQLVADVNALPERQRATLVMRELNGLGLREIARALEISTAAAKQSLFEARNSLRDFDRGRELECEEVRSAISMHDRRVLRGRRISAHLTACEGCRGYRDAVAVREADLRALVPALPAPAIGAMLARVLGLGRWPTRGGGGAADAPGGELFAHASASALIKVGAGVAIVAAGAAGAARVATRPAHPPAASSSTAIATESVPRTAGGHGAGVTPTTAVAGGMAGGRASRPLSPANRSATPGGSRRVASTTAPPRSASGPPTAAHATPPDERALAKPGRQSVESQAASRVAEAPKQERGHGEEGTSSAPDKHGPSQAEPGAGNRGGRGREQGERSSPERRSPEASGERGSEEGQPSHEPAHGGRGGAGRSKQSGE